MSFWAGPQLVSKWPESLKIVDVIENCNPSTTRVLGFIALSYVSGGNQEVELPLSGCLLRASQPKTIQDALIACDKFGYRYLWVHQLYINQKYEDELQDQIQINQMDRISQHATCTLVAMDDHDSNHGLSGVTVPRSWKLTVIHIGEMVFYNQEPNLSLCM
ncbi:uncharacterized protein EURHEDRAFT_536494 [Aspergillus ruber CBS 135680]|uniref:Heterokaryon incompatibility domain-containing protein n=1 Tax=Aspergillus ruber (strain CBS 135680) TaxID=1388766 RepID=A0A017SF90_ASPRC|nr:uncharacterized protein EURHEDRAFT_536494 [Aspergillus ruber CBS 135680]EYE95597.1 hypothetical protein EURHEDRAFT_536494 [Aspergillus ruber CBS 135680]